MVQFRAIDFAMENCELSLLLPPAGAKQEDNSTLRIADGLNRVDVWRLATHKPIDAQHLSWLNRPAREVKLMTIDVSPGTTFTHRFACPRDSVSSFELSGASESCGVEWWQDKEEPSPGTITFRKCPMCCLIDIFLAIFITQYSS